MDILLLLLIMVSIYGISLADRKESSLSLTQTQSINGIFAVLIFMSHFCQYIDLKAFPYTKLYPEIRHYLGQLVVVPFLFYSGYGVMEQIKKRKESYIVAMPKKRVFKTWLHFVVAVLIYFTISVLKHNVAPKKQILLSLIGWESIGNSNWYIFDILLLYLITYASFTIFKKWRAILCVLFGTILLILTLHYVKDTWWYDTILVYPVGMGVSYYQDIVFKILNRMRFFIPLFIIILCGCIYLFINRKNPFIYNLFSVTCIFSLVFFTCIFKISNPVLLWLGKYGFEIYILQRIPMILFHDMSGMKYLGVCAVITVVLAYIYKIIETKMDCFFKI